MVDEAVHKSCDKNVGDEDAVVSTYRPSVNMSKHSTMFPTNKMPFANGFV